MLLIFVPGVITIPLVRYFFCRHLVFPTKKLKLTFLLTHTTTTIYYLTVYMNTVTERIFIFVSFFCHAPRFVKAFRASGLLTRPDQWLTFGRDSRLWNLDHFEKEVCFWVFTELIKHVSTRVSKHLVVAGRSLPPGQGQRGSRAVTQVLVHDGGGSYLVFGLVELFKGIFDIPWP